MRLKSFHGSSTTEAMRLVREALGDNAIIVATREDETGGVRVTAAIDDVVLSTSTAAAPSPTAEPSGSEVIEIIARALLSHQVPTALAEKFLAAATQCADDDPVVALSVAFETHLQFNPIVDDRYKKPLIFIGTPGAGKTLCTAKFATKARMAKRDVTVISTDTERACGMEQLAAFTRLLNLSLMEIEDAHALQDAVAMQSQGTLTLIDTPGCNPFQSDAKNLVKSYVASGGGEAILVSPADIDAAEAIDMALEFRSIGANRLLFTRVDMTRRLGNLLRIAFETKMPLANFSQSHKVTEHPQAFNSVALARMVLSQQNAASAQGQIAAKQSIGVL